MLSLMSGWNRTGLHILNIYNVTEWRGDRRYIVVAERVAVN